MKKEEEKRTLLLPAELYDRLEERVKATGFGSVYEYVIFILEEALKEEGKEEIFRIIFLLSYGHPNNYNT